MVLREFQPDVVVGMGGYLAGPAMLEAALEDVPTVLIEPNAVPGFTNRVLAPVVRRAAVAYEETADYFGAKASLTGAPVRKAFFNVTAKEHLPPFTVLVLGGSQGSKAINQSVIETVKHLASGRIGFHLVHQTGERDYVAVQEAYQGLGVEVDVFPFIDDVPQALARADLVISRAGAISVAELAAAGKASLLVPFPLATDQHQRENARVFERAGAASAIDQHELTPERLAEEICGLLAQPERLKRMEKAAKTLARPDAVERIADMIEELAG